MFLAAVDSLHSVKPALPLAADCRVGVVFDAILRGARRVAVEPFVHNVTPALRIGHDTVARAGAFEMLGSTMERA